MYCHGGNVVQFTVFCSLLASFILALEYNIHLIIFCALFQFFITLAENLDYLDGVHTVFGEVVEGFDVLDKINEAICDEEHRPYQDIR